MLTIVRHRHDLRLYDMINPDQYRLSLPFEAKSTKELLSRECQVSDLAVSGRGSCNRANKLSEDSPVRKHL